MGNWTWNWWDIYQQILQKFRLLHRKQLINVLRTSTKHSYELSIPIYLKYLQSNMQSYDIILSFLAGEDWWKLLRNLYNGPYASKFLGYLENSFDIAEDLLSNFDEIHVSSINLNFISFFSDMSFSTRHSWSCT